MPRLFILTILLALALSACGAQPAAATQPASTAVAATAVPPTATQPEPHTAAPSGTSQPSATFTSAPPTATQPAPTATEPAAAGGVSFAADIQPLLQSRCIRCHGGDSLEEGLDMRTYTALMAGSANGPVVIPGDAANSLFVTLVQQNEMPKRGPKLTPEQAQLFADWVNQGALDN